MPLLHKDVHIHYKVEKSNLWKYKFNKDDAGRYHISVFDNGEKVGFFRCHSFRASMKWRKLNSNK